MENFGRRVSQLPPGFRFHPTDQELIIHYLRKKLTSSSFSTVTSIIADVDLYKYNPWELPEKALFGEGEGEWFFFSPRDRKYPNGARPNRAAACGYWKATGTDKPILSCSGSDCLGVKKALVFYKGRPPKGIKTDWVMHEYRLMDTSLPQRHRGTSMRLDDWVLCRVRNKGVTTHDDESRGAYQPPPLPAIIDQILEQPTSCSLAGDLYEWSDDRLLDYLLTSSDSQQDQGRETTSSSSGSGSGSGSGSEEKSGSLCYSLEDGYDRVPQQQPAQLFVSSMLDSIKRKLSFGALDELIMLQPPSKRLQHFSIHHQ